MAKPVIIGEAGSFDLAVNLSWKSFVVTGAASSKDAQAYVRSQKSNFWNVQTDSRKQVKSVGHASFEKPEKGKRILSLAQGFCANVDEHQHCIIVIHAEGEGLFWVVAVADGQVVQGTDVLVSEEMARQAVSDLSRRWPKDSARLFSNITVGWLPNAEPLSWDDLRDLALRNADNCELVPVKSATAVNKNVLWVLAAGVALLAINEGWGQYKAYAARKAAEEAAANAPKAISHEEAWAMGLKSWEDKTKIGLPDDLSLLLKSVGSIPLDIVGWEVRTLKCGRQIDLWGCSAEYDRRAESRATTKDLLAALPSGWRASWGPLDKVTLNFNVTGSVAKPEASKLLPATQMTLPALSFAQHHSRAFHAIEIAAAAAVPLELPKQPDGSPTLVDMSKMRPVPVVIPVKASGPLRSFALFQDLPISWNSFALDLGRNLSINGDASNGFVNVTEAKGEIYAVRD